MALHVAGFFTIRDGRISGWKDYYDQATYNRQMAEAGLLDASNDQIASVGLA
jgi:limonene-1,2-epoxide hydrolase